MKDLMIAFLLFLSGIVIFIAALGLKRFPDLYCRMHASCNAATLGKILSLSAAALYYWDQSPSIGIKLAGIITFFFMTAPVGAHLIARAGYKRGATPCPQTWHDDYAAR